MLFSLNASMTMNYRSDIKFLQGLQQEELE